MTGTRVWRLREPPRSLSRGSRSLKVFGAYLLALVAVAPIVTAKYPQDALFCLATLTEPGGMLICPEHRNEYCVKEVSSLAEGDCGRTSYFGDKWNIQTNKCEYRKCEASCDESTWDFEFEGETYERNRFCCNFAYCNDAPRRWPGPTILAWATAVVAFIVAQAY